MSDYLQGKPLLSVIIPCYNVSRFLPSCFERLDYQTYQNLDIIFINDGSTDDTKNLIIDYCKKTDKARLIDGENKGVGLARKSGLEQVKGEYFTFFDADDVISPNHFESLVDLVVKQNADLGVCAFKRVKPSKISKIKFAKNSKSKVKIYDREQAIAQYFSQKVFDFTLWNKIYSTKTLKESGATFIDCRYGEESYFCYNFLKTCNKVAYTPNKTYFYVQWKSSLMHLSFNESRLDIMKNLSLVEKDSQNYSESARNYLSSMRSGYIVGLLFFIKKSDYRNAKVINDLITTLKADCKRLKKCKKTALYRKLFIPFIPPIAKLLFRKTLKETK